MAAREQTPRDTLLVMMSLLYYNMECAQSLAAELEALHDMAEEVAMALDR